MFSEFWHRYQKIILIFAFIFITVFLGYTIYNLFFKTIIVPPDDDGQITDTTLGPDGFPIADEGTGQIVDETDVVPLPVQGEDLPDTPVSPTADGGLTEITKLNDVPSLGASIGLSGTDVQYYDQDSGQFYRINKNGNIELLSDKVFPNVDNVTWSPKRDKAILEFPDGANIIYDFSAERQITLPTHWKDFSFSPEGDSVIMKSIGLDPDNRWLAITNEDGSEVEALEFIGQKDKTVYPSWSSNNQVVAMYTKGLDFDRQEVFFVGQNDENFKSTIVEGRGFQPKWSPQGDRLLYSVYSSKDDLKPNLWIVNAKGEAIGSGRRKLNVETWANKCTFSDAAKVYCAVPKEMPSGAGLFPDLTKGISDNIYEIDTVTGAKKLLAIPNGSYSAENLIVSDNGFYLYFTDSNSKTIHQIKLK